MIASLTGILTTKSPTEITVDVNGVGYALHIPLSTFNRIGEIGNRVTLFAHLHVREDAMILFGFSSIADRDLFRLLISVSGIGPKIAQALLSGLESEDLRTKIAGGEIASLTSIPGVGRKTAERLVLELRDKVRTTAGEHAAESAPGPTPVHVRNEAYLALTSLGYARPAAEKAIRGALAEATGRTLAVEELVRLALKHAG